MEEIQQKKHACSVLKMVGTQNNTLKNCLRDLKNHIQPAFSKSAGAATPLEITLIDRLVNNIVPR